jgi:glutamate-1-semialdehyde 2,1-aminomutase
LDCLVKLKKTNDKRNVQSFENMSAVASRYIAGGVVSLNRKVDPVIIFKEGKGSRIYDINGKAYIDYHAAFAPYLLGHNYEPVNNAVLKTMQDNLSLMGSGTNELEVRLAQLNVQFGPLPGIDPGHQYRQRSYRPCIRLSRAYTGKEHIVLVTGGYNGWHNDVARMVLPGLNQIGPGCRRVNILLYPPQPAYRKRLSKSAHHQFQRP